MPAENVSQTITLSLKGSSKDDKRVRLNDFLHELDALRLALKLAETSVTGKDKPKVYYRIVRLSSNSPAEVTIEPVPLNGKEIISQQSAQIGIEKLLSDLKYIRQKKSVPPESTYPMIEAYRALLRQDHIEEVTIRNGEAEISIDAEFQKHITTAIGPDEIEHGAIYGRMEAINLHTELRFTIYPLVGPKKVECFFSEDMRSQAIASLDHRVEIAGRIHFKN